jgi:hypothetical protein
MQDGKVTMKMTDLKEVFSKICENKSKGYTITIKEPKDSSKTISAFKKSKIKFKDESSTDFTFKKEDAWDQAMEILDDLDVEFDFDG